MIMLRCGWCRNLIRNIVDLYWRGRPLRTVCVRLQKQSVDRSDDDEFPHDAGHLEETATDLNERGEVVNCSSTAQQLDLEIFPTRMSRRTLG
jgi:hypothetical protein